MGWVLLLNVSGVTVIFPFSFRTKRIPRADLMACEEGKEGMMVPNYGIFRQNNPW